MMTTISLKKGIVLGILTMSAIIVTPAFASEDRYGHEGMRPLMMNHEMRKDLHEMRKDFHQSLTDEQKDILDQAKDLRESGDIDQAKALLDEAGIIPPMMTMREDMQEHKEAVKESLSTGDYQAFLDATSEHAAEVVSEEEFQNMVAVYQLHEDGENEAARELAHELGLPKLGNRMHKKFMDRLTDEQKEVVVQARELAKSGDKEGAKALMQDADIRMPKPNLFQRIGAWFRKSN